METERRRATSRSRPIVAATYLVWTWFWQLATQGHTAGAVPVGLQADREDAVGGAGPHRTLASGGLTARVSSAVATESWWNAGNMILRARRW